MLSLLLVAAIATLRGLGQPAAEPGIAVQVEFLSERIFRGLERGDETVSAGVSWRGESWRAAWRGHAPLRSEAPAEWNLEGGWLARPGGRVAVEALATWSHYPRARGGMAPDTFELGVRAWWTLPREVMVGLGGFHDLTLEATTGEASVLHSVALTRLGAYLDLRAFLGWSEARDWRPRAAGACRAGGYGYFGADATLPYRIGEFTSVVVGLGYSEAWNARDAGAYPDAGGRHNLTGRVGVTFDF